MKVKWDYLNHFRVLTNRRMWHCQGRIEGAGGVADLLGPPGGPNFPYNPLQKVWSGFLSMCMYIF